MNLEARIEQRRWRIAVVGQGCVGLPLAVEFARCGFRITGIDRVDALGSRESYIAHTRV